MALIETKEAANRLARAIVSDILLYNEQKIHEGLKSDDLFDRLKAEIKEGLELYESRVEKTLCQSANLYNRALVDVLLKSAMNKAYPKAA